MFGFRLQFGWSASLREADLAVLFQPNCTLVREDDIIKCLSGFQAFSGKRETGNTVRLSNHLAVFGAASFPSKLLPGAFDG